MQALVHLAAVVSEKACRSDPDLAYDTNVEATVFLATLCQELGIERVVFASSTAIYDDVPRVGYVNEEETVLNPRSIYGRTKLQAERKLLEVFNSRACTTDAAQSSHTAVTAVILRLPLLYGPSAAMRVDTVVNNMAVNAYMTETLTLYGGGQWRPFLSTTDAAKAFVLAIASPADLVRNQTFNVGENSQNHKVGHIAQCVSRNTGAVVEVHLRPEESGYKVNFDKIHNELGFEATNRLDDCIQAIGRGLLRGEIPTTYKPNQERWGFQVYTSCRFCGGDGTVHLLMDLGASPLANAQLYDASPDTEESERVEYQFPLRLAFCTSCVMLHLPTVVPTKQFERFTDYVASEVATIKQYFEQYAVEAAEFLTRPQNHTPGSSLVVEIGCNDGVFLVPLQKNLSNELHVMGVDNSRSAKALAKAGYDILLSTFDHNSAHSICQSKGKARAIFAINSLLYLEDIHSMLQGVRELLHDQGVLIMQLHYVGSMLRYTQFDWISHENTMNCSLTSMLRLLAPHNLETYDLALLPDVYGGSIRLFIQHRGNSARSVSTAIQQLLREEQQQCLDKLPPYKAFVNRVEHRRQMLMDVLKRLKAEGNLIAGYGASGRATTLCSYYQLDKDIISYFIDDAISKHGKLTPGTHLPIVAPAVLYGDKRPDCVVLFAWTYSASILAAHRQFVTRGGQFIVPLPRVQVIKHVDSHL